MNPLPIALLGIPIRSVNLEEAVQEIEKLIELYKKDLTPRYVATLNVDFLVNTYHISTTSSRRPELLHVLRHAGLVTLDGMPLVWLTYLLGSPVKERVTGVELLSRLAQELCAKKQALFLLGGEEKPLRLATMYLEADNPGLRIVGSAHPMIPIEGENLETLGERDDLLIEQINKASPEILFLNLGNPKQEIWFERIRHKLRVPITIGIGGAINFITGIVPRAPSWMQKLGLEWLYRLIHEPKKLFKRYAIDLISFPLMVLPLLVYHGFMAIKYNLFHNVRSGLKIRTPLLFISAQHNLAIIPLPKCVNALACREIEKDLDNGFEQDAVVLDFSQVRHLDLVGLGFVLRTVLQAEKEKKHLFILGIKSDVMQLLKMHRLWDLVKNQTCDSPEALLERWIQNEEAETFYDALQQDHQHVIISFFGRLDNNINYANYATKIKPILEHKDCILDFTYCTYIDNTGLEFLLSLLQEEFKAIRTLKLCNLNSSIEEQLRLAKIDNLFTLTCLEKVLESPA